MKKTWSLASSHYFTIHSLGCIFKMLTSPNPFFFHSLPHSPLCSFYRSSSRVFCGFNTPCFLHSSLCSFYSSSSRVFCGFNTPCFLPSPLCSFYRSSSRVFCGFNTPCFLHSSLCFICDSPLCDFCSSRLCFFPVDISSLLLFYFFFHSPANRFLSLNAPL